MFKHFLAGVGLLLAAQPVFAAKTCAYTVESNDQMKFNMAEIKVAADCTQIKIDLKHVGKMSAQAMGHNWVLTKTADFMPVVSDAIKAGVAKNYVPAGDKRVIAHTKLIGGGESTSVTFAASAVVKGGDYTFFCSFPGHFSMMKGKFIVL